MQRFFPATYDVNINNTRLSFVLCSYDTDFIIMLLFTDTTCFVLRSIYVLQSILQGFHLPPSPLMHFTESTFFILLLFDTGFRCLLRPPKERYDNLRGGTHGTCQRDIDRYFILPTSMVISKDTKLYGTDRVYTSTRAATAYTACNTLLLSSHLVERQGV